MYLTTSDYTLLDPLHYTQDSVETSNNGTSTQEKEHGRLIHKSNVKSNHVIFMHVMGMNVMNVSSSIVNVTFLVLT